MVEPSGPVGHEDPARAAPSSPGDRRLAHPPSDRYRTAETSAGPILDPAASARRGIAFGLAAALAGSAAITILGGVLAITAGLLVVAAVVGWAVGSGLRGGAGAQLDQRRRVRIALVLTLASIVLGQAGLWAYGRSEGGVLAPLDYLWEVFGALVPLQVVIGLAGAWIAAR
jgi:hypothetical protein